MHINWYKIKKDAIEDYLNSESEGKEYDKEFWEDYNNNTKEKKDSTIETFGQKYYSPEAQGHW